MPHFVASDLGLQCLSMTFYGFPWKESVKKQGKNESANFRFLQRPLCLVKSFLQRLPSDLASCRVSAESRITQTVSAGSHFSWTVVAAEIADILGGSQI